MSKVELERRIEEAERTAFDPEEFAKTVQDLTRAQGICWESWRNNKTAPKEVLEEYLRLQEKIVRISQADRADLS